MTARYILITSAQSNALECLTREDARLAFAALALTPEMAAVAEPVTIGDVFRDRDVRRSFAAILDATREVAELAHVIRDGAVHRLPLLTIATPTQPTETAPS